jgi:hypothetical protein
MIDSPEVLTDAEVFYGSDESVLSNYKYSLADDVNLLRDRRGMSEAETDALMLESAHFFSGANIKSDFASRIQGQIVKNLHAPPSEEEVEQWATESRSQLRQRYPDADERMKRAGEYLASFPALKKQLEESGMASHKDVVLELADRAYQLRPRRK